MYNKALEILGILEERGYYAYIVGGYVRDKLLGIKSLDIDIATSATPKEIMEIFDIIKNYDNNYGAVKIIYKNNKYDITTFREDVKYEDNRKPVKIKYIKDIKKDLLRRDFTINTLCIDKNGKILDFLNITEDIEKKVIKTVGNPRYRIKEDVLRILRAIRFSANLEFYIDKKTELYITKYGYLLKKLSYNRKKEELDKIFSNRNKELGRNLLIKYKLMKPLELYNLGNIVLCDDILGIWSQLNVDDIYPFSRYEREQMKKIREIISLGDIDDYNLYKYGLYLCSISYQIRKINTKDIIMRYNNLPIYSIKDINIKALDISNLLNKRPGKYIKDIYIDLEKQIICNNLANEELELQKYILDKYK